MLLDTILDQVIADLPHTELSTKQHHALLLGLVDQRGIGDVLETLASVCGDVNETLVRRDLLKIIDALVVDA